MGNTKFRVVAVTGSALLALSLVGTPVAAQDDDHLARVLEWSAGGDGGAEGEE